MAAGLFSVQQAVVLKALGMPTLTPRAGSQDQANRWAEGQALVLPRLTACDPNALLLIPLRLLHNEMPA